MAESAKAARNPPCTIPTGLAKRSSASILQTDTPSVDLSTQTIPRVRSQLGGTCSRRSVAGTDVHGRSTGRSTASRGRFEGRPEEGPHVLEAFVKRFGRQRVPVEQRLHEADIAEVGEQRPVTRDHQLLRVVTAKPAGRHLTF